MKIKGKKILGLVLVLTMMLGILTACGGKNENTAEGGEAAESKGILVGVSMPTKSLQRWNQDGSNMEAALKKLGYDVELQFAENKIDTQVSQIENMITKGAKVLVVGSIDGSALSTVLESAKEEGIKVIAYDRLIVNTEAVDYYATFDNETVGTIQGTYIEEALGLKEGKGPFNLEITTGPLDDNNVNYFFGGAMNVLQPYIDNGQLVVKSGQTTKEQAATTNWDEQTAQARMDNIITANYTTDKIDAVLCSNDSVSLGVQSALKSAGYGTEEKPMPVITGQDCNIANVKAIVAGDQSMSVFKDTRALADKVVEMVDAIVNETEVPVNDTETYDNEVKVVPSYLLDPVAVDKDNYKELLIDGGYYTEEEVAAESK
ncbi:putative multiple sugar transport system substrate-binding protein [Anaerosphaera aminiphila DSM 21120]|uniref:Putative multiple sugar transport system substrate-binding protein n=1 Tax=Anaerosphaera aminiphila DSM 21120 TaxID=1120995 RepID=A0A1M5PPS2_9FIRM|nr:multiple monosaccharide ABC transporter substrate-binding protein [Anaerosphaera aminiphila]SHH03764.1 putative multiple sugar transport system substrate-binding protein [Anaerosphaera aminiphila DSM 21120]